MADYLPKFAPGHAVTFTATEPVIGGRLVQVTGEYAVAHADADSTSVAGVAGFDAAVGESVTIYPLDGVHRLTATGAVAAGARVALAADGKVAASSDGTIGTALAPGTAADDIIDVQTSDLQVAGSGE